MKIDINQLDKFTEDLDNEKDNKRKRKEHLKRKRNFKNTQK